MSSAASAAGASPPTKLCFCHQCERSVSVSPLPDGDVFCPLCCGGFVEELDTSNPNPNPNSNPRQVLSFTTSDPFFLAPSPSPLPFFFPPSSSPSPASFDLRHPSDIASFFGSDPSALRSFTSPPGGAAISFGGGGPTQPFNPFAFLHDHFHHLLSGGASIQVVLDGGGNVGGNLGDYFLGPGLEQLIQQLAENDPNRYGTPPASKSAVANLPDIKISCDLLDSGEAQCAVCMDAFEIGSEAKQLPCKHIFHRDCILPWLELHSSCPVCRYQLPADDPGYDQHRGAAAAAAAPAAGPAGRGAPGGGNSPGPRIVERRFRISLPWPFRAFGSQAEASNAGDGGGGGVGGGNANSGGPGNAGSETRQDDLD
ncbi:E3 ubiquitin-protein ligase RING1-like [Ananas comosus]|uniref:RING-type E3 ubiquitin transferase n=1 Tax=Ananas comosus TaxID=4615 RepID=A0A6P5E974_ANACO|nr:E3 ubiquitin-protein ligase RING1-like [Ananas comosus]